MEQMVPPPTGRRPEVSTRPAPGPDPKERTRPASRPGARPPHGAPIRDEPLRPARRVVNDHPSVTEEIPGPFLIAPVPGSYTTTERPPARPPRPAHPQWRRHARRATRTALKAVLVLVLTAFTAVDAAGLTVLSFRWWTPPRTAFMLEDGGPIIQQWVSMDHISRYAVAAALLHEDDQLGTRPGGFDINQFIQRAQAYVDKQKITTGSTIPQQLAKNMFLTPDQTSGRKAIEAVLSEEIARLLPRARTAEMYLNYAQFAPHLYGICAASWYYFNEPPWYMSLDQAIELTGLLTAPDIAKRAPGGGVEVGDAAAKLTKREEQKAKDFVNSQYALHGGWQRILATIGITSPASDHANTQGQPDACSVMPNAVRARLLSEGVKL